MCGLALYRMSIRGVVNVRPEVGTTECRAERGRSRRGFGQSSVVQAPTFAAEPLFKVPMVSGGSCRDLEDQCRNLSRAQKNGISSMSLIDVVRATSRPIAFWASHCAFRRNGRCAHHTRSDTGAAHLESCAGEKSQERHSRRTPRRPKAAGISNLETDAAHDDRGGARRRRGDQGARRAAWQRRSKFPQPVGLHPCGELGGTTLGRPDSRRGPRQTSRNDTGRLGADPRPGGLHAALRPGERGLGRKPVLGLWGRRFAAGAVEPRLAPTVATGPNIKLRPRLV